MKRIYDKQPDLHPVLSLESTSRRPRGFTLVELTVTMVAFAAIMIVAFGIMGQLNRAGMGNESLARMQSAARAASDQIEKDLRAAGVGIDFSRGQRRFVYADAYQVAFNANLTPVLDPDGTGLPSAVRTGSVPAELAALHTPAQSYNTGAETIVYTLDSGSDGSVAVADASDDGAEDNDNPRDMILYRRVFGWNGNSNTLVERQVALMRGPGANSDGEQPPPLFSYLIDADDDRITPPTLHGDLDGNGELDNAEVAALTPLTQSEMARLERITITVTGETERPDTRTTGNDGFRSIELRSEVLVRHAPRTSAIVWGVVFQDTDGDQIKDADESGIAGVLVRSSAGTAVQTDASGQYRLVLSPGFQTITEVDPAGFISSTPNTFSIDVIPGGYHQINFGDRSPSGSGTVKGMVFDDQNQNGIRDNDEFGIPGVVVYSDGGEQALTDANGVYVLTVPVGYRTISETDQEGYTSTTPNTVDVSIDFDGQTELVMFGDYILPESGTIEGYVFLDDNENGVMDSFEGGVQGAMVYAEVDSAEANLSGFFSITVPAGHYNVWEVDPPGYTSSTPNLYRNVRVDVDQTVTLYFGDIVQEEVDFDVITLADTERALSLSGGNLHEDNRGDPDLVLGTRSSSGANNMLIWHNGRLNHTTPNGALFSSTPSETRNAGSDIMSMVYVEGEGPDDGLLVLGLRGEGMPDMSVWSVADGRPDNAPNFWYSTTGGESVLDLVAQDFFGTGSTDFLVGVKTGPSAGSVELWAGEGNGEMVLVPGGIVNVGASELGLILGEASAVAMEDLNGDGLKDLVVGAVHQVGMSGVHVFLRFADSGGVYFQPYQHFPVQGEITDLLVTEMFDDNSGRPDIVVASATSEFSGGIELWVQHEDGRFGLVNEGARSFDDYMYTSGAPLVMFAHNMDNDMFPDILIGTRTSTSYQGDFELARTFGFLPAHATPITNANLGAVVTMTLNDFNMDNAMDLAVGTQNSATEGQVVIFFRQ